MQPQSVFFLYGIIVSASLTMLTALPIQENHNSNQKLLERRRILVKEEALITKLLDELRHNKYKRDPNAFLTHLFRRMDQASEPNVLVKTETTSPLPVEERRNETGNNIRKSTKYSPEIEAAAKAVGGLTFLLQSLLFKLS